MTTRRTRLLRRLVGLATGLAVLGVVAAEAGVRAARPQVPGLVWPDPGVELHATSWGPTWHVAHDAMERRRAGCPGGFAAGDRHRVVLLGADLLHGGGALPIDEGPGPALQRALSARAAVPICVESLAEPGLPFNAQLASARMALYGGSAEALVWSVGPEDAWPAVAVGETIQSFGPRGGIDGTALPARAWLGRSRLLATLVHRSLPRSRPSRASWGSFLTEALRAMEETAEHAGARLLVLGRPRLDRPFSDQTAAADPATATLQARCVAAGIPFLDLAAELGDSNPADLRQASAEALLDADGAETLGELVAPTLHRLLPAGADLARAPGHGSQ
jgi:hypothetical protein